MRVYVFGLVAASVLLAGCAPNRPASGRAEEVAGFTEMNAIVAELHRQVGRCWEPPRMNFREIPVIRLRVTLDADGSVRTVTILDQRENGHAVSHGHCQQRPRRGSRMLPVRPSA